MFAQLAGLDAEIKAVQERCAALRQYSEKLRASEPRPFKFDAAPAATPSAADAADPPTSPQYELGAAPNIPEYSLDVADPLATLDDFFDSLKPQHTSLLDQATNHYRSKEEPPQTPSGAAPSTATPDYDAIVHGVVQRAWTRAVRQYQSGALLGGNNQLLQLDGDDNAASQQPPPPTAAAAGRSSPRTAAPRTAPRSSGYGAAARTPATRLHRSIGDAGDPHPHRPASAKPPTTMSYGDRATYNVALPRNRISR